MAVWPNLSCAASCGVQVEAMASLSKEIRSRQKIGSVECGI